MEIFRGQTADGRIVRHDLIAPARGEAIGHQPDGRQSAKLGFDGLAGLLAMEEKAVDALLENSPGQFIRIGNKADEEIEIIFPGFDGNTAEKPGESGRGMRAAGAENQK